MSKRILIIEDEESIAELERDYWSLVILRWKLQMTDNWD